MNLNKFRYRLGCFKRIARAFDIDITLVARGYFSEHDTPILIKIKISGVSSDHLWIVFESLSGLSYLVVNEVMFP